MRSVEIGGRAIAPGRPCFIIAEAGVNHNGDIEMARRLVDAAADARAHAIKFQTFRAESLLTRDAPKAEYQRVNTGVAESQFEMLKRLELSPEAHRDLIDRCGKVGIRFLSTPFDEASADFLDGLGVAAFKIGSGDLTHLPLLQHVARKGKPLIVSTGMATLDDVRRAVDAIRETGNEQFVLLHCVSNYPADPRDVNLRAMSALEREFDAPCGYSDHTLGIEVPIGAAALGACVIEKHLTLDRNLPGPDHRASIEPRDFAAMVYAIGVVQSALGDGIKRPASSEAATADAARRSLVAARDLTPGAPLRIEDIVIQRPGTGMPPASLPSVLGRAPRVVIPAGTLLAPEMFE